MFEKYGVLRRFRHGECFMHSGDVMEYVGWIVSGGFKYSLTACNCIDNTVGFALSDSILINYESVMYSKGSGYFATRGIILLQCFDIMAVFINFALLFLRYGNKFCQKKKKWYHDI